MIRALQSSAILRAPIALFREFCLFGLKQAFCCTFGGLLLLGMLVSKLWYPFQSVQRYDFLLMFAIAVQSAFLLLGIESVKELLAIGVFVILAVSMEVFKTSAHVYSWHYPESFALGIGTVPLFVGFMYGAVGSYVARAWRSFDFQFSTYPSPWPTIILAGLIYVNFFTHHFIYDFRWVLLIVGVLLFSRCIMYFKVEQEYRRMPLMIGWLLVATFIWIAENVGTYAGIWLYPFQVDGWRPVPIAKLTSWYLLLMVSFVLVSLVWRPWRSTFDESQHTIREPYSANA